MKCLQNALKYNEILENSLLSLNQFHEEDEVISEQDAATINTAKRTTTQFTS